MYKVDKSDYKRECDYRLCKIGVNLVAFALTAISIIALICFIKADYSVNYNTEIETVSSYTIFAVYFYLISYILLLGIYQKTNFQRFTKHRMTRSYILESLFKNRKEVHSDKILTEVVFCLSGFVVFTALSAWLVTISSFLVIVSGANAVILLLLGSFGCVLLFEKILLLIRFKYLTFKRKYCKIKRHGI